MFPPRPSPRPRPRPSPRPAQAATPAQQFTTAVEKAQVQVATGDIQTQQSAQDSLQQKPVGWFQRATSWLGSFSQSDPIVQGATQSTGRVAGATVGGQIGKAIGRVGGYVFLGDMPYVSEYVGTLGQSLGSLAGEQVGQSVVQQSMPQPKAVNKTMTGKVIRGQHKVSCGRRSAALLSQ